MLYCFAKCTHVHCVSVYCITCKRFIRSIYKSVERSLDCCQNNSSWNQYTFFFLYFDLCREWALETWTTTLTTLKTYFTCKSSGAQLLFKNIMKCKWLAQPSACYILASTRLYMYKYMLHYSKRGKSLALMLLWLSFWNKIFCTIQNDIHTFSSVGPDSAVNHALIRCCQSSTLQHLICVLNQ